MSETSFLAAGTKVYAELDPETNADLFTHIPKVVSVGATGETAEAKDDTTLEDTVKTYGTGMFDTPDKSIKGRWLSTVPAVLDLRAAAREGKKIRLRTIWTDGTVATVSIALLGFTLDENTAEEWVNYTVNGKQSGKTEWSTVTELGLDPATGQPVGP